MRYARRILRPDHVTQSDSPLAERSPTRTRWSQGLAGLLVACCSGCPAPPPTDEEQALGCAPPATDGALQARTLEVGSTRAPDDAFVPWADGFAVPLTFGGQGAAMITPMLRIPAQGEAEDDLCLLVTIQHRALDGGSTLMIGPGSREAVMFVRVGEHLVSSGAIFDVLNPNTNQSFGLELTITVQGAGLQAALVRNVTVTR